MGCSSYPKACWRCGNAENIRDVRTPLGPEHRCPVCQARQYPLSKGLDHWPTWNRLKYSWKPMRFERYNIWAILRWQGPVDPQKRLPI